MNRRPRNSNTTTLSLIAEFEHRALDPEFRRKEHIAQLQEALRRAAAMRIAPPQSGSRAKTARLSIPELVIASRKAIEEAQGVLEEPPTPLLPLQVRLVRAIERAFSRTARVLMASGGPPTAQRAAWMLDFLSMWVPKRLASEEIGDALERINAMSAAGRPFWFIYLKVATTCWWVTWHSILHYAERIAGIIGKATGGKGE